MSIYRPWYKSFWKILALIVVLGVLLIGVAFLAMVYSEVQKIRTGETSNYTANDSVTGFTPGRNDDPYIGIPGAPVEIIAFEDFQCPFCQQAAPIMNQVLLKYPNKILFVYRDFPLDSIHPYARPAAMAAECADEQGSFWEYHDLLFENQNQLSQFGIFSSLAAEAGLDTTRFETCLDSEQFADEVEQDYNEGLLSGVTSTPTYFINGQKVEGLLTVDSWGTIIEAALESY